MLGSTTSRCIRAQEPDHRDEPQPAASASHAGTLDLEDSIEEDTRLLRDEECGAASKQTFFSSYAGDNDDLEDDYVQNRVQRKKRRFLLSRLICGVRRPNNIPGENQSKLTSCNKRSRPLRIIFQCLAIALMLLGLIEFILLTIGFIQSFFPSDFERIYSSWRSQRPNDAKSHWPTDYTADISPVQCHSHNDYWRPVPLKSAIRAGCTGVEADVWLFPDRSTDDLFVGHSRASLTPQRTFKSLYIEPLIEILERQNPNTTFHPVLDDPRNGVFDTVPEQSLVLLVDFKTDGQKLWSVVYEQLEPLRQRQYLTYFNGSAIVEGPVTVVVTGNAPFNRVVESSRYRDMFFDAPLELLGNLALDDGTDQGHWSTYDDVEERTYLATYAEATDALPVPSVGSKSSNQGQGHSGAAPKNPAIYTPANSYYASVAFSQTIGWPLPFLTHSQRHKIRQQIRGAHRQGLKVRYWSTPAWPKGLEKYIWRVLVEEGVDYLNVDDLQEATKGDWGQPKRHRGWGVHGWSMWD